MIIPTIIFSALRNSIPAPSTVSSQAQEYSRSLLWTKLEAGPMEGRGGTPLAVTKAGDIFVVGGFAGREMADIHKYSIKEGKWTTMNEVQSPVRKI